MVTMLAMKGGSDMFSVLRWKNISTVPVCLKFQFSVFRQVIFKLPCVFCDVL